MNFKELDLYNPFIKEKMHYTVLIRFKSGVDMCEIIDSDTAKDLFKLYNFVKNKNVEYIEYRINNIRVDVMDIEKIKLYEYKENNNEYRRTIKRIRRKSKSVKR